MKVKKDVAKIRRQIIAGTYETEGKVEVTIDRLLEVLKRAAIKTKVVRVRAR